MFRIGVLMTDNHAICNLKIEIAVLKERLVLADKALGLATDKKTTGMSEVFSIVAILISGIAIWVHK